jgi:hypothetical protein
MTFTDKTGQTWSLEMTLGDVTRCRKAAGVNLGKGITELGALAELIDDPDRFLSVVLVLTEGQRKAAGLKTQEEFEDRFDGPTLQAARVALTESVTNFYHPPKTAAEMTAALRMAWTAGDELTAAKIAAAANGSTSNDLATNSAAPAA